MQKQPIPSSDIATIASAGCVNAEMQFTSIIVSAICVVQVTTGFGSTAFFAYNLTSQQVYPVALPFAVPNTRCNYYTLGGNCDMCTC